MAQPDVKQVIDDLLGKFETKLAELRTLRDTIRMLSSTYEVEVTLPGIDDGPEGEQKASVRTINAGQFFGMSQTDAAARFLEFVRHPKSIDDILEGIQKGDCVVGGNEPRQTLYTQLVRATHRFVKLPSGYFGLLDWYPGEKQKRSQGGKKKKKGGDASASSSSEAPGAEDEIPDDESEETEAAEEAVSEA